MSLLSFRCCFHPQLRAFIVIVSDMIWLCRTQVQIFCDGFDSRLEPIGSDGHDKPFCTKAITIISKKPWAVPMIDESSFLEAISVIDKLSRINFSDKRCGKFSMC